MIIAIGFLLFLAISPCYSQSSSGSIKICVVGNESDASWEATINSIALYIAKNQLKAPQIFTHKSGDVCEFVGSVDRAKMRADFILVVKKHNSTEFNCDQEWGRQSFAILNLYPEKYDEIKNANENAKFVAKVAFSSAENPAPKWKNVNNSKQLIKVLRPRFMAPQSRIPDEYPFKAEREERVKRRTLKAVIALMGLTLGSLLVIMFLGSLSRHNESKKIKEEELEKKKKHEQYAANAPVEPTKRSYEASEKTEKSAETAKSVESGKSVKSGKTEKSSKTNKEKEPLIDKSKESEKLEKSSKKE